MSLGQLWLVGLKAFAFARVFRPFLEKGPDSWLHHVARAMLLGAGLTLFGVTITQHMLHHAGYRGSQLLGLSLCGSLLNVPFRIFCGAVTLHIVLEALPVETYLASLT
jgi:hypothetical protein